MLAHDDERAVIYEIDFRNEGLVKAWAFGDTPARGDFEGIAVSPTRVWLVASNGRLFEEVRWLLTAEQKHWACLLQS